MLSQLFGGAMIASSSDPRLGILREEIFKPVAAIPLDDEVNATPTTRTASPPARGHAASRMLSKRSMRYTEGRSVRVDTNNIIDAALAFGGHRSPLGPAQRPELKQGCRRDPEGPSRSRPGLHTGSRVPTLQTGQSAGFSPRPFTDLKRGRRTCPPKARARNDAMCPRADPVQTRRPGLSG